MSGPITDEFVKTDLFNMEGVEMPSRGSIVGDEGLLFFGKMSASISHELKNSLAIINEGAGLLEDFASMSAKGMPIDPLRLMNLGAQFKRQVNRSDSIIKRLNRFAHTIDHAEDRVDLALLLRNVRDLTERLTAMRGVVVDVADPQEPVAVSTTPFLLQNVVWLCLDFAMQQAGSGKRLGLSATKTSTGACIRLQAVGGLSRVALDKFLPADRRAALLDALKADIAINELDQVLCIELPKEFSDRDGVRLTQI